VNFSLFHQIPIWLDFVIFAAVILVGLEIGYRLGLRRCVSQGDAGSEFGQLILTSLFGVLGLMLAFTFGSGITQHKARKQAVVVEANALGTAYLRAGLVPEPGRSELREALYHYAQTRRGRPGEAITLQEFKEMVEASEAAKGRLWPITDNIVKRAPDGPGPIEASLVEAVNAVIDSGTMRLVAVMDTLPPVILTVLLMIAAITVAVAGFSIGVTDRSNRWLGYILALVLAMIMLVIIDFDRPNVGFIRVNQHAIEAAIAEMEADAGR
jgi:hypothetical protein